jgi:hypothetical protein
MATIFRIIRICSLSLQCLIFQLHLHNYIYSKKPNLLTKTYNMKEPTHFRQKRVLSFDDNYDSLAELTPN